MRLETLVACLSEENLSDGPPTEHVRNHVAGMMRQGLAVLAFSALESFIRERTAESLRDFDPNIVTFSDLSEAIQEAATIGATRGMLFRFKYEDSASRLAWALAQIKTVAASDTKTASMSHLSFASDKANLDEDDIPQILKAFGVDKPWPNLTDVAKSAGIGGLLDAKAQFITIKQRRHSSAHEISSRVPYGDLSSSIQAIRGIAIGFDFLLSHAVSVHNLGRFPGKPPEPKIDSQKIKLLFIAEMPAPLGSFEIYRMQPATQLSPATKLTVGSFSTKLEAQMFAVEEANIYQEQIVDIGSSGVIEDWYTW